MITARGLGDSVTYGPTDVQLGISSPAPFPSDTPLTYQDMINAGVDPASIAQFAPGSTGAPSLSALFSKYGIYLMGGLVLVVFLLPPSYGGRRR